MEIDRRNLVQNLIYLVEIITAVGISAVGPENAVAQIGCMALVIDAAKGSNAPIAILDSLGFMPDPVSNQSGE